ncbi:hypothetical protein Tco_1188107, partial [Tanacetum coccineum]
VEYSLGFSYLSAQDAADIVGIQIYARNLMQRDLEKAKEQLINIMFSFEHIYSPAFFDVMIQLVIHLPEEAILGGPTYYRWLYPFERYMKKLKNYGVETRFNRRERNEDGLNPTDKFQVFQLVCKPVGKEVHTLMNTQVMQRVVWFVLDNRPEIEADIVAYKK